MFYTEHRVLNQSAVSLGGVETGSIDFIVTSPPYPMIEMWDNVFFCQDREIEKAFSIGEDSAAFEGMHCVLDMVWAEAYRTLKKGCFLCVNIGDAARSFSGAFRLYSNHSRIIQSCRKLGFETLPLILWRKQTNAPNKFMGSGMLPGGAYVTLEHEYILIFRKNGKREFSSNLDKARRRESSYFWEERNIWFSDLWDFKGARQGLEVRGSRNRSGAFPFELAYRLINMFSLKGDTVLDPFLGTGTTLFAALTAERNCVGVEIDGVLAGEVLRSIHSLSSSAADKISVRLAAHRDFIKRKDAEDYAWKYWNKNHGFPVMTSQEKDILLRYPRAVRLENNKICAEYGEKPAGTKSTE